MNSYQDRGNDRLNPWPICLKATLAATAVIVLMLLFREEAEFAEILPAGGENTETVTS